VSSPRRLCPRCGSVVALQETYCRRCGADVHGGQESAPSDRYELTFRLIHVAAAVFASLMFVFARGSDLEFCGGGLFAIVLISLAVHYRRRPQYPVIKSRRRARRLKRKRVIVLAPVDGPPSGRSVRITGVVAWVAESRLDEIIVRSDSPVTTTAGDRSDLLALAPVESGEMFTTLLEVGRMSVGIWFLDPRFLSVRRINFRARRRLRPSLSLGRGVALLTDSRPKR